MYDATDSYATADEIVAAVTRLQDERDDLRRQLEEATAPEPTVIRTMDLPHNRGWAFVQDANVLAMAPHLDEDTRALLLTQVEPPTLTTCDTCGAPVWSGAICTMHDGTATL